MPSIQTPSCVDESPHVQRKFEHVSEKQEIIHNKRIHVLPFDDSIERLSGHIFDVYFNPTSSKLCNIPGSHHYVCPVFIPSCHLILQNLKLPL
ncbi:hypothetical protein BDR03DRAFT_975684 [Suillus americanus]|nr:hypothetical protein BDR03DRAFT_975684 [Suillus americanus]